jgi:hypothetical protein
VKEAKESGQSPFKPQEVEKPAPVATSAAKNKSKAESSAEMLQACHDIGNAIMPDPRWSLPDTEALEWGETTVALRDKHETIDKILDGGMYFRPLAKLFKIERKRAFAIVPEQGGIKAIVRIPYARTRARREQEDEAQESKNDWPDQTSNEDWNTMTPDQQQSQIQAFRERFSSSTTGVTPDSVSR